MSSHVHRTENVLNTLNEAGVLEGIALTPRAFPAVTKGVSTLGI